MMKQKRELFRVTIHRGGQLRRGTETAPCEITELTPYGIGLSSDLVIARGETVDLEFQLTRQCPIRCTILITHATPSHVGGRITAISLEHQKRIARYIEQHASVNLMAV
jgi:hypothetical protein